MGTAISSESLARFIFGARTFLANPSINFFNINKKKNIKNIENELENIEDLLPNIVVLEFNYRVRSSDIIWGQLKKLAKSISRQFTDNEFTVIKSECYIDNRNSAKLIFLLKFIKLPPFFEKSGPSIFMEKEALQFVKKNKEKSPMLLIGEDMKLSCLRKMKIMDAIKFLDHSIKIEKGSKIGIPKGLVNDLDKGFKIYTLDKSRLRNTDTKKLIHDFLFKDMMLFESRN